MKAISKKKPSAPTKDGSTLENEPGGASDQAPEAGTVELPIQEYHRLYDPHLAEDKPTPPVPFAFTRAEYVGVVGPTATRFHAHFELEVFTGDWTLAPLFSDGLAILEIRNVHAEALTLVSDYQHRLLLRKPGRYELDVTFLSGFLAESGKSGVAFNIPRAAQVRVELIIPRQGVDVTVKPSLDAQVTEYAKAEKGVEVSAPYTKLTAVLPPSDRMQIEWTAAVKEVEAPKKVKPLLTAEIHTLASVGEGVVICQSEVNYDVVQGQVSRLNFKLPGDVNVLSVTSAAVKSWRVRGVEAGGAPKTTVPIGEGETVELNADEILIEANLSYEVASKHDVHLIYERKMEETSGKVRVPVLNVLGVERQRGFVGVEARTNVEVGVLDQEVVARVDIQELPAPLWNLAQNPLLFGFKYLRTPFVIGVEIKKHLDVEVLVATIDAAHIEATLVEDGKMETKCLFLVRNNQQQFLRLSLPEKSTVWSTFVSNRPVKPAKDAQTGHVLLPLEKSQVVDDLQNAFPVEIVYLSDVPKLGRVGVINITCPKVDIPINLMLLKLHLPPDYRYSAFGGTMNKVREFSKPFVSQAPSADRPAGARRRGMEETSTNLMPTNLMNIPVQSQAVIRQMDSAENVADLGEMAQMVQKAPSKVFSSFGKSQGILPVKLDVPNIGQEFRFEKLIVLSEFTTVTAKYAKPGGWWS